MKNQEEVKTLVAYFSRSGEQYAVGNIKEGNTAIIAKIIASKTGADLFEIRVKDDNYPSSYNALTNYAKKEKQNKIRPKIEGEVKDIDSYDRVFIGYPNWWGDMPMPVYTFLESYDLTKVRIYHFCTSEGSGGVKSDSFSIYGHIAQNDRERAEKLVEAWLKSIEK